MQTIKVTENRWTRNCFDKLEGVGLACATFVFLTTYLPRSTCRLFVREPWRCPIQSVWSMLSWPDCDSSRARRFAGTGETRWNPRGPVPSSQTILESRSNRVRSWPMFRWPRNKRYRVKMAWGPFFSSSTRRERICPRPLQNRTRSRKVKISIEFAWDQLF